jgi:hypothetical protein
MVRVLDQASAARSNAALVLGKLPADEHGMNSQQICVSILAAQDRPCPGARRGDAVSVEEQEFLNLYSKVL